MKSGGVPSDGTKDERQQHIMAAAPDDLFDVKAPAFELPENARLFRSIVCENCGESAAENHIRMRDGKMVCRDCCEEYSRFM